MVEIGTDEPNQKDFTCNLCGKTFENEATLNVHKRLEHSDSSLPPAGVV